MPYDWKVMRQSVQHLSELGGLPEEILPVQPNQGATARDPKARFSHGLTIRTLPVAKQGRVALRMSVAAGSVLNGLIAAQTLRN
jgi:hypothetical protein